MRHPRGSLWLASLSLALGVIGYLAAQSGLRAQTAPGESRAEAVVALVPGLQAIPNFSFGGGVGPQADGVTVTSLPVGPPMAGLDPLAGLLTQYPGFPGAADPAWRQLYRSGYHDDTPPRVARGALDLGK